MTQAKRSTYFALENPPKKRIRVKKATNFAPHFVNQEAPPEPRKSLNDKRKKVGIISATLVIGILSSAAAPASAVEIENKPFEAPVTQTIPIQVQTISVSSTIVSPQVTRDAFTATSEAEIAAMEAETARVAAATAATAQAVALASSAGAPSSGNSSNGVIPTPLVSAESVIQAAQQWVGVVPYGDGNNPNDSFSCDGFTQYVYSQVGITLPRTVSAQYALGTEISASAARAGDLLVWKGQHVGIYDGNGGMYDSPYAGRMVQHRTSLWGSPVYVRIG